MSIPIPLGLSNRTISLLVLSVIGYGTTTLSELWERKIDNLLATLRG